MGVEKYIYITFLCNMNTNVVFYNQVQVDDNKNLVIARILEGGTIDKQGLLHAGDVILEINSINVYTPEDLQSEIARSKESVTLKIGPADGENTHAALISNNATNGQNKVLTVRDPSDEQNIFLIAVSSFSSVICVLCLNMIHWKTLYCHVKK